MYFLQMTGKKNSHSLGSSSFIEWSCVVVIITTIGWHLAHGSSEPNNPWHFLKELNNKVFQMCLNILSKLWLFFAVNSRKYKKWAIFDILMTITPGVNMLTRQMIHIFFIYSLSFIRWYISFLHFKTFKIQFHGVSQLHYVLVFKIHIYMPKMILSSLLT